MKRTGIWMSLPVLLLLAVALPVAAQQPTIANAQVETRSAAAGLERTLQSLVRAQTGPAWAGYAVPIVDGSRFICCSCTDDWSGPCQLESRKGNFFSTNESRGAMLEGPRRIFVLLRLAEGRVQKIRAFTEDCQLDAGGLKVFWLSDVQPGDSVSYLSSFVRPEETLAKEDGRKRSAALNAIALHNDPAADHALERFVAAGQPRKIRKSAAFWLGSSRGRRGFEIVRRVVRNDKDDKFRKDAVFALNVSKEPEAVDELIRLARNDRSKPVRKQALFWLGQKAGKKAIAAISDAIENDPDTDIKKRAVFALSRLPKDRGVPLLIKVASTNRNLQVRKRAMFWLGQSGDPRALAFFQRILSNP